MTRSKKIPPPAAVGRWGEREVGILDVARKLFAKDGYDSVSMVAVAKAAGLSEGTLYNYFRDKRDLVIRVGSVNLERRAEAMEQLVDQAPDFATGFELFIAAHLRTIIEGKHIYRIWMREVRSGDTYDASDARAISRRYTNLFIRLLERWRIAVDPKLGLSPAVMRDLVLGGAEHVAWTAIVQGREKGVDIERTAADLTQAYLRAFGLPVPSSATMKKARPE